MARPNILYIHSHDTGRYVQPFGYAMPTPNIQRLAEQGMLFRQAFCVAPQCSPSRAGLLTGQAAHSSGMIGLAHRGFTLRDDNRQHIVHTLRRAGYHSALIGVQHVAFSPLDIGYDEVLSLESHRAEHVATAAVEWLHQAPQPFFVSVGFDETHRVYPEPGPQDDARYCRPPAPLPDTPRTRHDMAAFMASVRRLDAGIGAVFDALEANGLEENTLVVCTTDHGIAFPAMKCNLTDHGTGVMLILRGPGGFAGGCVSDALISQIDLFPTLCELAGIEPPAWLQGRSLMPLVRGEVEEVNEAVYSGVTYHAAYEPMRAVRTRRWKYIRRFDGRTTPVLPNCDDSPSKDLWLEHGWRERPVAEEQIYDLIFDPNESANLAGRPEMAAVLDEMRGRLERWMRETDDPLLHGRVPMPPDAVANDPDGLSPQEPPRRA